jgi:hypothetical protein
MIAFRKSVMSKTSRPISDVLSPEHRARLEAIVIELQKPDLPVERRAELIEICDQIAAQYDFDPRLCE